MFSLIVMFYVSKQTVISFGKSSYQISPFDIRDVTVQYFLFEYRYSVLNIYLYFNIVLPFYPRVGFIRVCFSKFIMHYLFYNIAT